jgi:UPF0042 nucleotide-binding protein
MKKRLFIIVGSSGSGLSTAIKALEDRGFYCIDNLPIGLILETLDVLQKTEYASFPGFAFGVHIRSQFTANLIEASTTKLKERFDFELIFLEASDQVLMHRYGSSRRPHPLLGLNSNLSQCIELEKKLLAVFRNLADVVFDTSDLSPYALARLLESRCAGVVAKRMLFVLIQSFGFKYGALEPAESIYDVRFLENPFFVKELADKTGTDPAIVSWLSRDPNYLELNRRLVEWHRWMLPLFYQDGRPYYRVGIGCTGGRHRSVAVAESLYAELEKSKLENISIALQHRDIHLK